MADRQTEDDCRRAADASAAALMRVPGVRAIGVGSLPSGGCCVVVYAARGAGGAVGNATPRTVRTSDARGRPVEVPVRVEEQDELTLE